MSWKIVTLLGVAICSLCSARPPYSEQKVSIRNGGALSDEESRGLEHHEKYAWAYPSYEFSYRVSDHHTHDIKGQHEHREGDKVKGLYWLVEPTGRKRIVKYNADKHQGFKAHVGYMDKWEEGHENNEGQTENENEGENGEDRENNNNENNNGEEGGNGGGEGLGEESEGGESENNNEANQEREAAENNEAQEGNRGEEGNGNLQQEGENGRGNNIERGREGRNEINRRFGGNAIGRGEQRESGRGRPRTIIWYTRPGYNNDRHRGEENIRGQAEEVGERRNGERNRNEERNNERERDEGRAEQLLREITGENERNAGENQREETGREDSRQSGGRGEARGNNERGAENNEETGRNEENNGQSEEREGGEGNEKERASIVKHSQYHITIHHPKYKPSSKNNNRRN